jgi:hypothetical protein
LTIDVVRYERSIRFLVCLGIFAWGNAFAYPNLDSATQINGLTIYQDAEKLNQHYYLPVPIEIATTENGRPALMLMMSRYVGTRTLGDQGDWITRNFLSVRLHMPHISDAQLNTVKASLRARGIANPRIKRLGLYGIEGAINFTPVDSTEQFNLPATGIVTEGDPGADRLASQWTERTYSLSLGDNDAQLLSSALESGQTHTLRGSMSEMPRKS